MTRLTMTRLIAMSFWRSMRLRSSRGLSDDDLVGLGQPAELNALTLIAPGSVSFAATMLAFRTGTAIR